MKSTLFALALAPALSVAAAAPVTAMLTMDNDALTMTGELSGRVMPRSGLTLPLSTTRPAGVVKEPAYKGTPHYGTIRLGNGPRAETRFVMDRAPDDRRYDNRLYFDRNHNGDFTDDGDGEMQNVGKNLPGARVGPHFMVLPASWGDATHETASGEYGFMCLIGPEKSGGPELMLTRTAAARTGYIELDGKLVRVALIETAGDGIFDIAKAVEATPAAFATRAKIKTMTLVVDADGNGQFGAAEVFDATLPFQVGATTYQASATADGSQLTFIPTTRAAQAMKVPRVAGASTKDAGLLASGTAAPDFTTKRLDGRALKLSDLRGKVVVLDFWATWCIPCIRSMPHVQKTVAKASGGEVVWLGVCVWDDQKAFEKWVPVNDAKYSFTKVFDPAGKDRPTSIASKLYKVTGIPTLYVIGANGHVVDGLVGFLGDDDNRLEQALTKAGLKF
ncbi:MAG: TlpA family protein disulfide reductase [Opitutus sp.]|nr:TlpA family protein disulfide reductase [Opitutus sp.]